MSHNLKQGVRNMGVEARNIQESRGTVADESYVGQLIGKWRDLLEGIPDRNAHERRILGNTAILMENQSRWLRDELTEDSRSVNVGGFTKFVFPVLRRVFPNLITNELVSVQPMTAPIGAVFFLDYIYGTTKGQTVAGSIFPRDFDRDYSSEFVNGEPLVTGDGTNFGGGGTSLGAVLGFTPVRPLDAARGFSVVVREVDSSGTTIQEATDNGAGGFTGDVAAGSLNYSNGALTGFLFTAAPANGNAINVYYYYDGELSTKVPQMQLDVKKAPIQAETRRMKAIWSSEAGEDLRALHGLDAETEIVASIAREISLEIDREVLNDLLLASTGTTATFDRVPPAGINELDHLKSMLTTFATVSNIVHRKTLRAPANWIVTSPEVSALFTQLQSHGDYRPLWNSGYVDTTAPADMVRPINQHGQFGIYKAGTISNKWMVYEDPFFTRDQVLLGLKGDSYMDAGYVWAPYIPLQITPTFLDPSDFGMKKGLRTRYAKKLLRPDFYGQVRILNL